jgi:mannose-6-phosphate isomerase
VVFEVQQNSDVTFRLYDWKHVDRDTGQTRPLQVDQALACTDFGTCAYFRLWRVRGELRFAAGSADVPRVLVGTEGNGQIEHGGAVYAAGKGDVFLLPAVLGLCTFQPRGAVNVLEIEIPE